MFTMEPFVRAVNLDMMGRAICLTASQLTPNSKEFQMRPSRSFWTGQEKQDPLHAARPRPSMEPTHLIRLSLVKPDTTKTVFRGSAHSLFSAFMTFGFGERPLVTLISLLRYFPTGSFLTNVPPKSIIRIRFSVESYASLIDGMCACEKVMSFSSWLVVTSRSIVSFPLESTASLRSLSTFFVHIPDGREDINSISRTLRPSRSAMPMDRPRSSSPTVICTS
mmetsp:Transcript_12560/g.25063  ORF Transcript_12560/g.25063 Transcript_12560/m.25063 type:complete len:222 (-) Transcript_12560:1509-2174(-)